MSNARDSEEVVHGHSWTHIRRKTCGELRGGVRSYSQSSSLETRLTLEASASTSQTGQFDRHTLQWREAECLLQDILEQN